MQNFPIAIESKLNNLLTRTYDAEKGFNKAAEHTESLPLKAYFKERAQEREQFSKELKKELNLFNAAATEEGSLLANAHRNWMDVKALFSSDNEEAMLQEAIRGEKTSIEDYNEVLTESTLPKTTATLLTQQKNKIATDLSRIRKLEDIK
ncbi:PA2169 family four-helix-bundle protein [uncultured Polaribacter sp.]|uniref:ferritin-like domain-containing protein n=1 Tax=uncultured Polaribacter sp. TaxID=174711 RepID=UPI00261781C5|nr:PA2169 family four-helix-bundle protein [uncultured Polaribacter sp.]